MTRAVRDFIFVLIISGRAFASPATAEGAPPGFLYLRDIDPTIEQDLRYAGSDNFVGHPLPGYEAAECVLRVAAARALQAVQADLAQQGFGIKVYDCYRPARAVGDMVTWAAEDAADPNDERFFPRVSKRALLRDGYIAKRSTHSTGLAVDLTLVRRGESAKSGQPSGPCRGPVDDSLDMGTTFDCFDPMAQTVNSAVDNVARQHRALLLAVMQRHGFSNYSREWWHFSYRDDHAAHVDFDFSIVPRPVR